MFTIWNALWYIINLLINLDGMIVKGKNAFIFYKDHTTAELLKLVENELKTCESMIVCVANNYFIINID